MSDHQCEVLREIQLGHIGLEDVFEVSGVSPSDGRRHLLVCATCAASMDEVRVQLRHFDWTRLAEIDQDLRSRVEKALQWAESSARDRAGDIFDSFSFLGGTREDFVNDAGADFVRQNMDRVYLEIIRAHSVIGGRVADWFDTFLPSGTGRNWLQTLSLAPDLIRLLCNTNQEAAKSLLRALLLKEAFGSLTEDVADAIAPEMNSGDLYGGDPWSPIAWASVWDHYTVLSGLSFGRLSESLVGIEPRSEPVPEGFENLLRRVEQGVAESQRKLEEMLQGQTA
ncbi:MAG: hypothetical protein NTW28_07790, partial [Candidatus Solibacter sp.]|nr:hypothetical protein [Candidatus Solibacter sp.]